MKRILYVLSVAVLMAVMMVAMAAPAFAKLNRPCANALIGGSTNFAPCHALGTGL